MVQHMPDRPRKLRHMRMVWMLVLLGFGTLLALAVLLFADAGHADAAGLGGVTDAVSRTTAAATATLHDAGVVPPLGSAPVPLPGVPAPAQPVVDSLPATASTVVDPAVDAVAPVAGPVVDIVDPVLAPITSVVDPIVAPITSVVDPIVAPVVHPVVPPSGGRGAATAPTIRGFALAIPRDGPRHSESGDYVVVVRTPRRRSRLRRSLVRWRRRASQGKRRLRLGASPRYARPPDRSRAERARRSTRRRHRRPRTEARLSSCSSSPSACRSPSSSARARAGSGSPGLLSPALRSCH